MAISKEIRKEIENLFAQRERAEWILEQIGFPMDRLPQGSGRTFWASVFPELDNGTLPNGGWELVEKAAEMYPNNPVLKDATSSSNVSRQGASLTIQNVQNIRETIALVREIAAGMNLSITPAFNRDQQLSFHVDADEEHLRSLAESVARRLREMDISGSVKSVPFHDYILQQVIIEGPDTARYEIRDVPASTATADVGAAILGTYPNIHDKVQYVIDSLSTGKRLHPDLSLHENGVREGDIFAATPVGAAGGPSPEQNQKHDISKNRPQNFDPIRKGNPTTTQVRPKVRFMPFSKEIRKEIQKLFAQRERAEWLLEQINFPLDCLPQGTGRTFWTQVFRDLENGILPNFGQDLLELATEMFPYNKVLKKTANLSPQNELFQGGSLTITEVQDLRRTIEQVREIADTLNIKVSPALDEDDQLILYSDSGPESLRILARSVAKELNKGSAKGNSCSVIAQDYANQKTYLEGSEASSFELINMPTSTRKGKNLEEKAEVEIVKND